MRFPFTITATVATFLALSAPVTSVSAVDNSLDIQLSSTTKLAHTDYHQFQKKADEHDHDHPPPTASIVTPVASPTPSPATPDHAHSHEDGHNHDDHDTVEGKFEDEHDHDHSLGDAEHGHSHGPARTCEAHDHSHGAEYIVWHHIVALLVLTVIAGLGCALPMMIRDNSKTRFAVQLGKYFGAGVVLSVAFIHILPEALFALTHPCLSKAWTDDYPGYAPLIMMVSGLVMLVIEFLASTVVLNIEAKSKKFVTANAANGGPSDASCDVSSDHGQDHKHGLHDHRDDITAAAGSHPAHSHENDGCSHAHGLTLLQCGPGVSTKVSTYMLEVGIALHSVFIGIALGVLAGSEFLAMTIAICFHQFFEGVALGSRIADLSFPRRKWLPFLLVAIFALVTPLGIAIGMGMRTSYKANSVENLIVMGVTDSIACGVLLYTAFVTLLGGDILYSERFRTESRSSKASYLVAVWLGALSMAVIALWA